MDTARQVRTNESRQGVVDQVVVPVEGSTQEWSAQQAAVEAAAAYGATLRAVHVATGPDEPPEDLFHYVTTLCDKHGIPCETVVIHGTDAVEEILAEVDAGDLIVAGTRLLGTEYHLGSFTEALIRRAPCPVQVIRLVPARNH